MKRLLVLLMVLGLLFTGAFAVKYPVEAEVTGKAYFVAVLDEEGIDLAGGSDLSVKLLPTSGVAQGTGIKVSFDLTLPGSGNFKSLEVTTPLLDLAYYNGACYANDYVFHGVGARHVVITPKLGLPGLGLTAYFADIVSEVDLDEATPDRNSYFDDAVGLRLSVTNLDFFNITLFGAFYDADNDPATNTYRYAAHLNIAGKDVLSGLVLNFAIASGDVMKYLIEASYSRSFTFDPVTVSIAPYFVYSEGRPIYSKPEVNWNKQLVKVDVSAEAKIVEGLKIFGKVVPEYDFVATTNAFKLYAESGLNYSSALATANAKISWDNALASATNFVVTGDVTVKAIEGLALTARARYLNATQKFGYNFEAAYTYGPLTLGVFYGTLETPYNLYDPSNPNFTGDLVSIAFPSSGNVDIDAATWFVYLKTSLSF